MPSDEWEELLDSEENTYRPASLAAEGFIHCSTEEQLLESASLYFADHRYLAVLEIPPKRVKDILKWEYAESRGTDFPHLYGPLALKHVENTFMLLKLPGKEWEVVK